MRRHLSPKKGQCRRLVSCYIKRDGVYHQGFKSHGEIRRSLKDENPYTSNPSDEEGFVDSEGNYLSRREANAVAIDAGQCSYFYQRDMLSSDIDW